MSNTRDWGAAYEKTWRTTATTLQRLQREGVTFYRFGDSGRTCNPRQLSPRALDGLARLHAERVVNRAIHQHNEQIERPRARG